MRNGGFRIRRLDRKDNGFKYVTYQVVGYLNGERLRKKFKSREDAVLEVSQLEALAAEADAGLRPVTTRLSREQVAEAEVCVRRLAGKSLSEVVDWYLANYRPPCAEKPIEEATKVFLAQLKPNVELCHFNDVRRRLEVFEQKFPKRMVGTFKAEEIRAYLESHGWANKSFNNARGALGSFFEYCAHKERRWIAANPIADIPKKKVVRGLPAIETAAKIADLFAFLETYTGGARKPRKAGFLVPYFALATFGGMRPAVPNGEVWKLGHSPERDRLLNFKTGVIHVTPDIAKTDDIRQVKIRPNLAAWLARYPVSEHPIVFPNMQALITEVRKKFELGDDVLRHTFISAHVAKFKSMGEAALEAGNSEAIIRAHYSDTRLGLALLTDGTLTDAEVGELSTMVSSLMTAAGR